MHVLWASEVVAFYRLALNILNKVVIVVILDACRMCEPLRIIKL